jgi:hypothetical protein
MLGNGASAAETAHRPTDRRLCWGLSLTRMLCARRPRSGHRREHSLISFIITDHRELPRAAVRYRPRTGMLIDIGLQRIAAPPCPIANLHVDLGSPTARFDPQITKTIGKRGPRIPGQMTRTLTPIARRGRCSRRWPRARHRPRESQHARSVRLGSNA